MSEQHRRDTSEAGERFYERRSSDVDLRDLERRLDKMEETMETRNRELTLISTQLQVLTHLMEGIPDRMRLLEVDISNSKLILKGVTFLGSALVGTSLLLVLSYLFGGGN